MQEQHQELERQARQAFDAGDLDRAATLFIEHCGGEILGFLVGRMGSEHDAAEVFSEFAEDLWRGLPDFQWRCSMRSWAYTLARNAAYRFRQAPQNDPRRNRPLHRDSHFAQEVARLRTATVNHLRTEVKSRMRELREQLPEDDQVLLILRIDKKMSWKELAAVLSGEGDTMDVADRERWAARLRQRFQTAKERLRELARAEGLVS